MTTTPPRSKWLTITLLCVAELLAMSAWFSASAVVPALTAAWNLSEGARAWLTMSVQIGFVVGAFGSALLNLPDRVSARRLFAVTALLAGLSTALIAALARGLPLALMLRFLTGLLLAGVYPVGMKIMATWTKEDRGLGIGLLVGALTVGSALPHLLRAFGSLDRWQPVLVLSGALTVLGGLIAAAFIEEGPYRAPTPPFDWGQIGGLLRQRDVLLANLGYLGHMWELYAMWAWIAAFLADSFARAGVTGGWASGAAAATIAAGGVGSWLAGQLADRVGRTTITTISMAISGLCALGIGRLFDASPYLVTGLALLWGLAVVADSAQFSACVSELCQREYTGTALTLQTSLGFLLTLVTIRLIPTLERVVGWEWAFAFLAPGPLVGIVAMQALRRSPGAAKLAGGRG